MNSSRTIKGGGNLKGKIKVPGDKSISHRALIIGSIAQGETTIEGFLHSEDPLSTADCLRKLGVNIPEIKENETFTISGIGLDGIKEPKEILNCGNSGTTMRLLMGLLAGQESKNFILQGTILLREANGESGKPLSLMGGKIFAEKWVTKLQFQLVINLKDVL